MPGKYKFRIQPKIRRTCVAGEHLVSCRLTDKQFEAVRLASLACELNIAKWIKASVLYALKHGKARKRPRAGEIDRVRKRRLEMLLPDEIKCLCGLKVAVPRTALNGISSPGVYTGCANCGKISECLTSGHAFTHVDRVCSRCGVRKPFFIPFKQVHWRHPDRNPPGFENVDLGPLPEKRAVSIPHVHEDSASPGSIPEPQGKGRNWSDILRELKELRPDEANAKFRDLIGNNSTPWGFSGWSEQEKIVWLDRYCPLQETP